MFKKVLFLIFIFQFGFSQERELIKGKVIYRNIDVPAANVVNNTSQNSTITNENGLSFTRISQGDNKIVNVCKSCGKPDYLFSSEAEAVTELQKASEKAHLEKQGVRLVNWIILILCLIGFVLGLSNGVSPAQSFITVSIIGSILWFVCSGKTHL